MNHAFVSNGLVTCLFLHLTIFFFAFNFGSHRILTYLDPLGCLIASIAFGAVANQNIGGANGLSPARQISTMLVLFALLIASVFGQSWGPINRTDNLQATDRELTGIMFFFEVRIEKIKTQEIGIY